MTLIITVNSADILMLMLPLLPSPYRIVGADEWEHDTGAV